MSQTTRLGDNYEKHKDEFKASGDSDIVRKRSASPLPTHPTDLCISRKRCGSPLPERPAKKKPSIFTSVASMAETSVSTSKRVLPVITPSLPLYGSYCWEALPSPTPCINPAFWNSPLTLGRGVSPTLNLSASPNLNLGSSGSRLAPSLSPSPSPSHTSSSLTDRQSPLVDHLGASPDLRHSTDTSPLTASLRYPRDSIPRATSTPLSRSIPLATSTPTSSRTAPCSTQSQIQMRGHSGLTESRHLHHNILSSLPPSHSLPLSDNLTQQQRHSLTGIRQSHPHPLTPFQPYIQKPPVIIMLLHLSSPLSQKILSAIY